MNGKVFLIGAGPGDVELLTLKAVRALRQADVVLIDDLVNREVLQFVSACAEIIEVGKRGGGKSTPQDSIHELMVTFVQEGKCVARVKGGDPFIFGRGGEELLCLRAAGIEVEIIGGITSGVAAAQVLGAPLTHRDFSHGITLITGQCCDGVEPEWRKLAESDTTLVIYMGMKRLPYIVDRLISEGMRPDMPAAIIQSASLPDERIVSGGLHELPDLAEANALHSPAIIIIGETLALMHPEHVHFMKSAEAAQECEDAKEADRLNGVMNLPGLKNSDLVTGRVE